MRNEYKHECSEDEIEFLEFLISFLQKRGFAWDMFLRPFRIRRFQKRIEYLKVHPYGRSTL